MATLAFDEKATPIELIQVDEFIPWMTGINFDYPYSAKTVRQYHRIASELVEFAKKEGLLSLDELNAAWLRKFISRPKRVAGKDEIEKYAPSTRITRQSALNLFWRWAMDGRHAFDNPIEKLVAERSKDRRTGGGHGGRKTSRKPPVLSWVDQDRLIDAVLENSRRFSGARDYALIMVLLTTGLRSEEACTVLLRDFDLAAGQVSVIGKGDKERLIRFGADDLKQAMEIWLPIRERTLLQRQVEDPGTLFITTTGKRLIPQLVYQQVSTYLKAAGIRVAKPVQPAGNAKSKREPCGPHVLRHTAASRMLARGVPIRQVMENLGHANIATTQIYSHLLG